jgi:hypothetical protein
MQENGRLAGSPQKAQAKNLRLQLNSPLPQPLAPLGEGSFNSRFGFFTPKTESLAGRE